MTPPSARYSKIPEEFQAAAAVKETRAAIDPTKPTAVVINPANLTAINRAWMKRAARNTNEVARYLRNQGVPKEKIELGKAMLKAAVSMTRTEHKIFNYAGPEQKLLYMHRIVAIRLGCDFMAKQPEHMREELTDPEPPSPVYAGSGILRHLGTPMADIPKEQTETDLTVFPAPVILAWQGTVSSLILAGERPEYREQYLGMAASWNRIGERLCE